LKILESRGFLHWDRKTNKYDLHPIVRRFAYNQLTAADRTGAHERLVNYFEAIPKSEKVTSLEDLAPVIELYHHMVRAGILDEARVLFRDRLANALYFQLGAYQLIAELLRALFLDGEDKPPRLKDESAQAWTLNMLAAGYAMSGQPRRAVPLVETHNTLQEKRGSKDNLARGLGNVATQRLVIGGLSAAESDLRHRIDLCREITDEFNEAIGHQELGRVLSYRGAWQEAKQELNIAIKLFDDPKNGVRAHWIGLTHSYFVIRSILTTRSNQNQFSSQNIVKEINEAIKFMEEFSKTNYPIQREYVRNFWLLGAVYRSNNDLTLAEENLSKALNLCRQINNVEHEADILLDLARLCYAQGDFKDAQEKVSEALLITERSGYVLQGADVNLFLAQYALEQEHNKAKAKQYAEEAKKLATCDGPPYYYRVAYEEAERMLEKLK
jgi:tetratricopeptide (TPR) repeat protein